MKNSNIVFSCYKIRLGFSRSIYAFHVLSQKLTMLSD